VYENILDSHYTFRFGRRSPFKRQRDGHPQWRGFKESPGPRIA